MLNQESTSAIRHCENCGAEIKHRPKASKSQRAARRHCTVACRTERRRANSEALSRASCLSRFWAKVDRSGGDLACWPWIGSTRRGGYGDFRASRAHGVVLAHRASYEINVGAIPPGLFVLHSCDNPPCVNPAHLRVGTNQDNVRDCVDRGRKPVGVQMPTAKLNEDKVRLIREMASNGATQMSLAALFGVSQPLISGILGGTKWKHVRQAHP